MSDPSCSAVVFTHHRETHSALVRLLKSRASGFTVYEIHGAMDNAKRHAAVREFQGRGTAAPTAKVVCLRPFLPHFSPLSRPVRLLSVCACASMRAYVRACIHRRL